MSDRPSDVTPEPTAPLSGAPAPPPHPMEDGAMTATATVEAPDVAEGPAQGQLHDPDDDGLHAGAAEGSGGAEFWKTENLPSLLGAGFRIFGFS